MDVMGQKYLHRILGKKRSSDKNSSTSPSTSLKNDYFIKFSSKETLVYLLSYRELHIYFTVKRRENNYSNL